MNWLIKLALLGASLASLYIAYIGIRSVVLFLLKGTDGGTVMLLVVIAFFVLCLFQPQRGGR